MNQVRVCAIVTATILALGLAACGGAGGNLSANGTTNGDDGPSESGKPMDRVTDEAAGSLTDQEVAVILEACKREAGIAGTNEDCINSIPRELPPCRQLSVCIHVGQSASNTDVGFLQLRDERPGSPACDDGIAALCEGVTVPADLVTPLIKTLPSPESISESPSEPIDEPTEPIPTTPPIITPSEP